MKVFCLWLNVIGSLLSQEDYGGCKEVTCELFGHEKECAQQRMRFLRKLCVVDGRVLDWVCHCGVRCKISHKKCDVYMRLCNALV